MSSLLLDIPKDLFEHHVVSQLPVISCIRFLSTCRQLWMLGRQFHKLQQEIQFWKIKIQRKEFDKAHALAIEKREFEIVELLELQFRRLSRSATLSAVSLGNLELFKRYVNQLDPAIAIFCLKKACELGHKTIVDLLIARGVEADGNILFHSAIGGNKDIVDFFIARGHQNWNLGLKGAVIGNHTHLVDFFVKAGPTDAEDLERSILFKEWKESKVMLNCYRPIG